MALDGASVLITGGCGQIGIAIINHLQEKHPTANIAALDLKVPPAGDPRFVEKVTYYAGNITHEAIVRYVFNAVKPLVVFHTAGLIPSIAERLNMNTERHYTAVNVEGTRIVLEAAKSIGSVKAFVYTSSADVVKGHNWEDLIDVDESKPIPEIFDNQYAKSKALAELLVLSSSTASFPTTAIRPHAVFGAHDNNLLPIMLSAPRNIHLGPGTNLYDFTYAPNLALGHALAATNLLAIAFADASNPISAAGKPFFVTNDEPIHFRTFATALWAAYDPVRNRTQASYTGFVVPVWLALCLFWMTEKVAYVLGKKPVFTVADLGNGLSQRWFNNSRARAVLGYAPSVKLAAAIGEAVEGYKFLEQTKNSVAGDSDANLRRDN